MAAFFVFVSFSVAATAGLLQCILSKIFSAAVHATVFLCYFSYFFTKGQWYWRADAIGSDIHTPSGVIKAADSVKANVCVSWLVSGRASGL